VTEGLVLHWARAYDALVWVLTKGKERRFREHIVDLAGIAPGESVLDVGCGTGSLALAAKRRTGPAGDVRGVDASAEMVARAAAKAAKAGVDAGFRRAEIEALPFPDASFDVVLSTLMLHHLTDGGLPDGIGEIRRVLKPGGRFLAVDIGGGKGHRHGPLLRARRHASFDLDEVEPVLDAGGLHVVERGPIERGHVLGLSNLRFVLAR
jgi:ubiquinone/menaquinone biosynthesis C-methylase UbiE